MQIVTKRVLTDKKYKLDIKNNFVTEDKIPLNFIMANLSKIQL